MLAEVLSVDVPHEAVRRMTEGIGAVVEAEEQALIAAARRGEDISQDPDAAAPRVRAVEVDGIMVHTDRAWHEAKVGAVAPLGPEVEVDADTGRERLR